MHFRAPIDFSALRDLNNSLASEVETQQEIKKIDDLNTEKAGAFRPVIKQNARQNSTSTCNVEKALV